jgi:hypothetical protein
MRHIAVASLDIKTNLEWDLDPNVALEPQKPAVADLRLV